MQHLHLTGLEPRLDPLAANNSSVSDTPLALPLWAFQFDRTPGNTPSVHLYNVSLTLPHREFQLLLAGLPAASGSAGQQQQALPVGVEVGGLHLQVRTRTLKALGPCNIKIQLLPRLPHVSRKLQPLLLPTPHPATAHPASCYCPPSILLLLSPHPATAHPASCYFPPSFLLLPTLHPATALPASCYCPASILLLPTQHPATAPPASCYCPPSILLLPLLPPRSRLPALRPSCWTPCRAGGSMAAS